MNTSSAEHVAALERGLRVLHTFSQEHAQLTLSEVAALTRLSPATVRRSLHTLERLGYVGRTGRKFLLRPKVLAIGAGYLSTINAEAVLQPFLQELVGRVGGSAAVALLDELDVVYVAHASANRFIRVTGGAGARYPAHATATGRVLLAFAPTAVSDAYFQRATFQKFTALTEVNPGALRVMLEQVRLERSAAIQDELDYGLSSVAVPVKAPSGRVVAAAACADVTSSASRDVLVRDRLPALREMVARLERTLAHHPELVMSVEAGINTTMPESSGG